MESSSSSMSIGTPSHDDPSSPSTRLFVEVVGVEYEQFSLFPFVAFVSFSGDCGGWGCDELAGAGAAVAATAEILIDDMQVSGHGKISPTEGKEAPSLDMLLHWFGRRRRRTGTA